MYVFPDMEYTPTSDFYRHETSVVVEQKGFDCYITTQHGSTEFAKATPQGAYYVFKDPKTYSGKMSPNDVFKLKRLCSYIKSAYNTGDDIIQHDGDHIYIYTDGAYYQGSSDKKTDFYKELMTDDKFDELIGLIAKYTITEQKEEIK
ncbi:MAG: hypothetical protein IJL89_10790 [Firmicutes bacterium]|nr:hypothetical protein [Bacillota bacterium]